MTTVSVSTSTLIMLGAIQAVAILSMALYLRWVISGAGFFRVADAGKVFRENLDEFRLAMRDAAKGFTI